MTASNTLVDPPGSKLLQNQMDAQLTFPRPFYLHKIIAQKHIRIQSATRATEEMNSSNDGFYAFIWLNTGKTDHGSKALNVNEKQLEADLVRMDRYLSHKTRFSERITYSDCPRISRSEVYRFIEQEGRAMATSVSEDPKKDEKRRMNYERRVDLTNAAEFIFQFFLPSKFEGPTVLEYWGAIHRILVETSSTKPRDQSKHPRKGRRIQESRFSEGNLADILEYLESMVRDIQPFKDLMSQAEPADRAHIDVSVELPKAWLHLIMSLALTTGDSALWVESMNKASNLIDKGMKKMMHGLTQKSLLEKSVLMPLEVASLINFQLLQDITGAHPDIVATYSEYVKELEADVEGNPVERAHQDKITHLKQEITVIQKVLIDQSAIYWEILTSSRNRSYKDTRASHSKSHSYRDSHRNDEDRDRTKSYAFHSDYDVAYDVRRHGPDLAFVDNMKQPSLSQLSATDPGGYRDLLAQECVDITERRIRNFHEMEEKAADLATENLQKLDTNRDRQESAIYAFTIVTIVFLPLSTVAGILGMNTKDVRNMDIDQRVFWAVAIPLMVIVIVLCLIWAGELGNFGDGFANLWRRNDRSRTGRGYAPLPDRYNEVTRYYTSPPRQAPPGRIIYGERQDEDYYFGRPRRNRRDLSDHV